MAVEKKRIVKQYLVLCEGVDTQNFMIRYLNSDALNYDPRFSNEIQTFDFSGINDLGTFLHSLKNMENFDNVNRLLILRDAETDPKKAIRMIQNTLKKADLPVPKSCHQWSSKDEEIKTAFTLMPACNAEPVSGALEDLGEAANTGAFDWNSPKLNALKQLLEDGFE